RHNLAAECPFIQPANRRGQRHGAPVTTDRLVTPVFQDSADRNRIGRRPVLRDRTNPTVATMNVTPFPVRTPWDIERTHSRILKSGSDVELALRAVPDSPTMERFSCA